VPAPLVAFAAQLPPRGRVLIPGCGSGYEVRLFQAAGWEADAIDFAPGAVERARAVLGELGARVRQADFFADDLGAGYDLVYERTFLCSLPPACWPAYAARVAQVLRPGGALAGVFFYGHEPEPPPFPLNASEASALFVPALELVEDRPIPADDSLPLYAGGERWQVWRRKEIYS
jgi:thiopurine S-methyltransferase